MASSADYPYVIRCSNCEYSHNNGPSNWVNLKPGNFCPKCGEEFQSGDCQTKREYYEAEDMWVPEEGDLLYADDELSVDAEAACWAFRCHSCESPDVVEGARDEVYGAVCTHEEETGHFRFSILYDGELVDGI